MRRLLLAIILFAYVPSLYVCAQQVHAVIINGGRSRLYNHERYWNDCAFLYRTLRNDYHVPKRNITLLMSDGGQPDDDMILADNTGFASSPTDLDGDSVPDVSQAASSFNLRSLMVRYAQQLTADDHLLVFLVDHGGLSDAWGLPYVWLWNNEQLNAQQLDFMLDQVHAGSIVLVLGQCYAGSFVPYLQGERRVVIAACQSDEVSWSLLSQPYDEFVYHWTCAVAGHDPQGNPVNADTDGNGRITMDEVFNYACQHDKRPETPLMTSQPETMAGEWSLAGGLSDGIRPPVANSSRQTMYAVSGMQGRAGGRGITIGKGHKIIKNNKIR